MERPHQDHLVPGRERRNASAGVEPGPSLREGDHHQAAGVQAQVPGVLCVAHEELLLEHGIRRHCC